MLLRFLKKKSFSNTTGDSYVFGSIMMSFCIFMFLSDYVDKGTAICLALTFGDILFTLIGLPFLLIRIYREKREKEARKL